MKFHLRSSQIRLSEHERSTIESRIRLAVGREASQVAALTVVLSRSPTAAGAVLCRIDVKFPNDMRVSVEEGAKEVVKAVDFAIWRLRHRLDRRSLREPRRY